MGYNSKDELMDDLAAATAALLAITWSANPPTASNAQTIADGDSPSVAETGQAIQNINTILTALIADVALIRADLNAQEVILGLNTKFEKASTTVTDSLTADAPAGGSGATAGAYDSAANRNLMIATVNGLNATVASILLQLTEMKAAMNAGE